MVLGFKTGTIKLREDYIVKWTVHAFGRCNPYSTIEYFKSPTVLQSLINNSKRIDTAVFTLLTNVFFQFKLYFYTTFRIKHAELFKVRKKKSETAFLTKIFNYNLLFIAELLLFFHPYTVCTTLVLHKKIRKINDPFQWYSCVSFMKYRVHACNLITSLFEL